MTKKKIFLVSLLWLVQQQLYAQFYSTATAATGAEIIVPVGTESNVEMIRGTFYPGRQKSSVELRSNGIQVNGIYSSDDAGPTLHVISSQQAYSLTHSFDPLLQNHQNSGETIRMTSLVLRPVHDSKQGQPVPDLYAIGATFLVGPYQAPGQYSAGIPYTITVHFN